MIEFLTYRPFGYPTAPVWALILITLTLGSPIWIFILERLFEEKG